MIPLDFWSGCQSPRKGLQISKLSQENQYPFKKVTSFFMKYFHLQCLVKRGKSFYMSVHLEIVESVQEASATKKTRKYIYVH